MPIKMKVEGMDEISAMLGKLGDKATGIAARGLYDGAGIMADEITKGAEGIQTAPFEYAAGGKTRLPSPEEKDVILGAGRAGIAKFKKDGGDVNTSVGYRNAGYAEVNGKTKPIPVIVNAINSGTSFMKKQPFVRKAANSGGKKAAEAIRNTIEAEVEAITKQ